MGEAVISRAGGSGEVSISNSTKELIGVSNSASLDDCLQAIAYKDSDYATILCTIYNPDDSLASDGKIRMDDGIVNVVYNSDNNGKVVFKTNRPQVNLFLDEAYTDIKTTKKQVDTIVGSVKSVDFHREVYSNTESIAFSTNGNLLFSNLINTIDIYLGGGGGAASSPQVSATCEIVWSDERPSAKSLDWSAGACYKGGNGYFNSKKSYIITPYMNYQINIGAGGPSTSNSNSNYQSFSEKYSSYRSHRVTVYSQAGASGGTSRFGSVLSAAGGSGGSTSSDGTGGSGGGVGGQTGSGRGSASGATITAYGYGAGGNNGSLIINNFQYK